MNPNLTARAATFVQNGDSLVSDMNGEKVMMSIQNGKYYNLGAIGGRIWELVAVPQTIEQLATALMEEYEVDRDTCEAQVRQFLDHLLQEKLIKTEIAPA
ncbi:lasso peptide biosynthesis PqqD family chaperone [Cohnella sp. REN36]|uniref:lasso peptide biosynthesis PqqD family chaperone n=1 Tax=Cohnella sp. REN36 TaxID=2887347 RepID=UPI001D15ACEE|nr:lasso peptide biosynthesis PqqD family chaperone [Cohnella sp. REN36]MCC3376007.1 lasso peptide biosynthesis PqqD family chaperone [Cohnella sp. REN36]